MLLTESDYIDEHIFYRVEHFILRAPAIRASNPQNALTWISFH